MTNSARATERRTSLRRAQPELVCPLSDLQQGMLYQHLTEPDPGVNVDQLVLTLREPLDPDLLQRAWMGAVARHQILRAAMAWEGIPLPEQRVFAAAPVPWHVEDLRTLDAQLQEARFAEYLEQDRRAGFRLERAPLYRFALIRLADAHYRLVWTLHHILLDGRSRTLLLREVFDAYEAARRHEPFIAPPAPPPFSDFTEWQRRRDPGPSQQFWREQLRGFVSPVSVAGVSPVAQPVSGRRNDSVQTRLSAETSAALSRIGRENGLTMTTLAQGAWAVLLSRHSGEEDVAFGVVRARRRAGFAGAESMIGMLINTLPLRTPVPPDAKLVPWLTELRDRWRAMRDHEHVALADIQSWSELRGGHPLFDTLVMVENGALDARMRSWGPAWAQRSAYTIGQTALPLTLQVFDGEQIAINLEFDRARVTASTAARALRHLGTLLDGMAADPSARLGDLPILDAAERDRLLEEWNDTARELPLDTPLHELVSAQVMRTPDAVAVQFDSESLTYAELDRRANQLARLLHARGVAPGALVGVCLERSLSLVVSLLAVLKAGAGYVPLDPEYPPDRLAAMLEDAEPPVVVTRSDLHPLLPPLPSGASSICVDTERHAIDSQLTSAPEGVVSGELAYVIFTSGSTGRPKGAQNHHRGIVNRLTWMQSQYGLGPDDAVLQKTPASFDVSVWEFFWPLIAGARLVLARPGGHKDPDYLCDLIVSEGITVCHFVPSMLRAFLEGVQLRSPAVAAALRSGLRHVICSGEALDRPLQDQFFDILAGTDGPALHNLYGPTECAVDVTHWTCRAEDTHATVPIGRPIANTRVYVLDPRGNPAPVGVSGELHLGGVQVGAGYRNRPDLTAERFVPDPFTELAGARLYRTGDRVAWADDGVLEFQGRLDSQVKLRGFRIELGEIEAVLGRAGAVAAAAVAISRGPGGEPRLVGYYVAEPGVTVDEAVLRDHLRRQLPEYMVPAVLMQLAAFPLTPSGKLDRKALPEPLAGVREEQTDERTDNVRDELARIWEELLGLPHVGMHDNFFDLGGHSLLAVRLVHEINQSFGRSLALSDLFHDPTIDHLATLLAEEALPAADQELMVNLCGGSGTPLFFLHGDFAFGGLYCQRLARHLGTDHPVYALHPHPPGGPATVVAMATDYVDRIVAVQPHGPYRLAGVCNGGIIAFEVARQLERRSESVQLLAMIDSRAANVTLAPILRMLDRGGSVLGWDAQRRRQYVSWHRGGFLRMLNRHPWIATGSPWVRRAAAVAVLGQLTLQGVWRRMTRVGHVRQPSAPLVTAPAPRPTRSAVEMAQYNWGQFISQATDSYIPAPFGGTVTLIWGEEEFLTLRRDQLLGWDSVARRAELRVIPGGHHTILTRHLDSLGSTLSQLLAIADAGDRRRSGSRLSRRP
jgi:amino acid adenylation domain-containing protein